MNLNELTALSPIDGRYRSRSAALAPYLSEWGLMKHRVEIEVEYFIALTMIPLPQLSSFEASQTEALREVYRSFSEQDAQRIKDLERVTNHDVKAVEYFLKEKLGALGLDAWGEFVHFGLTSQDVNNTAIPLSLKRASQNVLIPMLREIRSQMKDQSVAWKSISMLSRTHGQPASPVTLGKEWAVFINRLDIQLEQLECAVYSAKFGGATGQFNAHFAAYPHVDWSAFANAFVEQTLGLKRSQITTQIDHYDRLAEWSDNLRRIHTVLIDFSRDVWTYISMDYFKQKIKEGEIGSSAMPHKVNPIDFENAEGNMGVANAMLGHFSEKLPISRLQRDLTDSTVLRNLSVPLAHSLIALHSLSKGLGKLVLHPERIQSELNGNWAIVAEGIQTILRREGYPKPYEALKELTRGKEKIDASVMSEFIDGLNVSDEVKSELKKLTPHNYIGQSIQLVDLNN